MKDAQVIPFNNTFLKVESTHDHVLQEISQYFTIQIPNAEFMRRHSRYKYWDGKLRLFNVKKKLLYVGLLSHLIDFLKERNYSFAVDISFKIEPTTNDVEGFIESLNLPYEPRDYQTQAIDIAINKKRCLILSSTGSGKSLIIYSFIRFFENRKILLVVPTISLTTQMYTDFIDYSKNNKWNVDDHVHVITGGIQKTSEKNILISTWQSLYTQPKEYFQDIDILIVDEVHGAAGNSLRNIGEYCINADRRIGLTGTLQDTETHKLVIQGLFGDVYRVSNTKNLQNRGILSDIKITMVMLKYSDEERHKVSRLDYSSEMDFLCEHLKRNTFLVELIKKHVDKNVLLLTPFVEKHGKILFDMLLNNTNQEVYFLHAETPKNEREEIRQRVEQKTGVVLIATYGLMSTGVNIKNLHSIIFGLAGKSKIRNIQSIGRGLRLHDSKEYLELFDVSDDLSFKGKSNYSMKHAEERFKQYINEHFKVISKEIDLKV